MYEINNYLRKHNIKPRGYHKLGKVILVDTFDKRIVIKEKIKNKDEIFNYLKSRNFDYYPKIIEEDDTYEIMEYIEDVKTPLEQKVIDMIDLVALLHAKTTFYKEIDYDEYKTIYEDLIGNTKYLNSYYYDLITIIETKIYMSPKEYLLARNINIIFDTLDKCNSLIEKWYLEVKEKTKRRYVVVHNNLDYNHFLKKDSPYLISWNKAKIDSPIFDLYKLYKNNYLNIDFETVLKRYESSYPLLKEEKDLLYILILLPDKIEFKDVEYISTKKTSDLIDSIIKVRKYILKDNMENSKTNE